MDSRNNADFLYNQAGMEQSYSSTETMKAQNVRFSDQHNGATVNISGTPDATRGVTDTNDTSLGNFFSRPIKVFEWQWAVATAPGFVINPWSLYFSNTRVKNRITNYNLLRANLHIKVVINGNGFYYGKTLFAYLPMYAYNDLITTAAEEDIVSHSQCPKLILDATTSMGGEMIIPFHYHKNNANVQTNDINELGSVWIRAINALKHANGGTQAVNCSIFAWAEDVELSVLTSMDASGLVPQMGDETDEANSKGIVSGPATTVAKVAGMLKNIPVLSPYATATSKAASMVASIAGLLGYCKPVVTKAPEPYRPQPTSSLSLTNVPDVSQKLSVDHKQELTIDPVVVGYGDEDLLSVKSIAGRESYWLKYAWAPTDTHETLLASMRVDPCLWREVGVPTATVMTASCAAALPFKYWTGTMKFRFQFVCSAFHKGRVKIVYDPNQSDGTEYNVNYMRVVDLAEENDVTIEIGMGQDTTLREHFRPGTDTFVSTFDTVAPLTRQNRGNGTLSMYVINALTTPSVSTETVEVNVYVSMGDDFETFVPDEYFQAFTFSAPPAAALVNQAGYEADEKPSDHNPNVVADGISSNHLNAPIGQPGQPIAVQFIDNPKTNLVFTGESIQSFRSILKRFTRWRTVGNFQNAEIDLSLNMYPFLRGDVSGAIDSTAAAGFYNYVNTLPVHWVTYMFAGWRGSMRYKLVPRYFIGDSSYKITRKSVDTTLSAYSLSVAPLATARSVSATAFFNVLDLNSRFTETGFGGSAISFSPVNNSIEWEVPYYSRFRYVPGKIEDLVDSNDFMDTFVIHGEVNNTLLIEGAFELWNAVGEDFQVYMFTGLPRMYYDATPPLPTP